MKIMYDSKMIKALQNGMRIRKTAGSTNMSTHMSTHTFTEHCVVGAPQYVKFMDHYSACLSVPGRTQ